MTQKEILGLEKEDNVIFLHQEGIFWKLYERSAFWFVQNRHAFRATRRYVKNIGVDVVSIGFPMTAYDTYASSLEVILREDKMIMVRMPPQCLDGFAQ